MTESVFKALADPNRRRILKLLAERPMTAGEIAEKFNLAKSTLSGHFTMLKAAELIQEERRGATIVYSLNLSVVEETLAAVMDLFKVNKDKPINWNEIES
ncbi:autorepressor SdpR family transcription factor [Dehalogenimonas etheniformans]|uniref:ArsR family transcriptional regulator n=1 Tax=Dehalogenimonas etheniformans TaxID=1536648 RepID=A0A2P5P7A8_9CHLR|nr:autorepressor SdpR family transcription factor [Dehalogenimonas etheniformans]PPD58186.1 ArsR family transcriptional regulator [Dehalogenimonas etheniformans]QNT75595.1 winged helix-turn-helix transcriptional regulator [Dehalogenimonas etheniformans]